MNIQILNQNFYQKAIAIVNPKNPFHKKSIQYYLVDFVIRYIKEINQSCATKRDWYTKNNDLLIKFLATKKEIYYIDQWNAQGLFEQALSLCFIHDIVCFETTPSKIPRFGLFAEDGLFDVLVEESFTKYLSKGNISHNMKLLWLSIYMSHEVRYKISLPTLKLTSYKENLNYHQKNFTVQFQNFDYANLHNTNLQIPFSAFSPAWPNQNWIALNSRGLFHHIGDEISFFYAASQYGECYLLGKNQYNQLVTLSTIAPEYREKNTHNPFSFKLFTNTHYTDFEYIYGVPKGYSFMMDHPVAVSANEMDCKINDNNNNYIAESFWKNPVFMKYAGRKFFVGSLEDKFIEILENLKSKCSEENKTVIQKIINNQKVEKKEIMHLYQDFSDTNKKDDRIFFEKLGSFFIKSIAHKTICEIFNPPKDLKLSFFMKNNGIKPNEKTWFIIDLLPINSKNVIFKPLQEIKKKFINLYFYKDKSILNLWSANNKKGFMFSEVISMANEYRMFIINNRVVATTPCFRNTVPLNAWQNGRFDPRMVNGHNDQDTHINRQRAVQYAKFAKQYCKEMKENIPNCKNYVLDVAWCEEKKCVVPIEMNSITWSGAYQLNMHRLCSATIGKKFQYEDLEKFLIGKFENWIYMIEDGVIDVSFFDMCGLERTLKSKTLSHLESMIANYFEQIENLKNTMDINTIIEDIQINQQNKKIE